jgi:hypothetical protein
MPKSWQVQFKRWQVSCLKEVVIAPLTGRSAQAQCGSSHSPKKSADAKRPSDALESITPEQLNLSSRANSRVMQRFLQPLKAQRLHQMLVESGRQ